MATVGIQDLERNRDETFDFLCVVCKGKNINTEAEMFCHECHDYYCSSCVKYHYDISTLKNHQILDKSTAPLPAVPTERCKKHKDNPVDMYCKNHDVVECSVCMLGKHSSCKVKQYIPDFIKNNTKATNSNSVEGKLESIAKSLTKCQEAFFKEMEDLKDNKDNVLKEIGTFRKKIIEFLDQFKKNIVLELEQRLKSLNDKIDSSLGELQAISTEIKAAQDSLKSAGGNISQKFVSVMQANKVVSNAEKIVKINESQFSPTEIYFLANKKLQKLFSEIQDLGSIRVSEKLRITNMQKYPVESDSETCDIISVCTLNDGTIILADWNNSKLKVLDSSSYTVTHCCDVPKEPWQVCAITGTEVAVSCVYSKLIQFVNVGRKIEMTRQINTGFRCQGLAYADERLYDSGQSSLYMFLLSGELLQHIFRYQSGQGMLSDIWGLAINSNLSRIYVTGKVKDLMILDMNFHVVGQYNVDEFNGVGGVSLDKNDNVLVCGRWSRNVLQFSPNGKLIGEVLKTDGYCNAVCFKNNKLIVGFLNKDKIEVYDINAETLL